MYSSAKLRDKFLFSVYSSNNDVVHAFISHKTLTIVLNFNNLPSSFEVDIKFYKSIIISIIMLIINKI